MRNSIFEKVQNVAAPVEFKKTGGLFGATTLGVGAMLGAGLYVLIGLAAAQAGPSLWISYTICGILTLLTVLVYAEFARRSTTSGGGYFYSYDQLGSFWGFPSLPKQFQPGDRRKQLPVDVHFRRRRPR